jgi:prepilin-type N-terminal cleavage/methylation domain-containing protein
MKRRLFFNSQRGFSLIEMTVALGVAGILAALWMSVQRTSTLGQKTLRSLDEARENTRDVAFLLSDPAACLATFGGQNPSTGYNAPSLKNGAGKDQYTIGQLYGSQSLILSGLALGGPGVDSRTNTPLWMPMNATDGIAFLSIDWKLSGGGDFGLGAEHLFRYVLLKTVVAGGVITACVAEAGPNNTTLNNGSGKGGVIPLWTTTIDLGNSVITQFNNQLGFNIPTPASTVDVPTGVTVGSIYSGNTAPPPDSMIVSSRVGIGVSAPGSALEVNGNLELDSGVSGSVALQSPAAGGATAWTLPNGDGAPNQVLTTDGAGNLSFATICSGQVLLGCVLPASTAGVSAGACDEGYAGTCKYTCQASGLWLKVNNGCN